MRYYLLLVLVTSGGFAAASLLSAGLVTFCWPFASGRLPQGASHRARRLAALRLAPFAAGAASAAVLGVNFLRYEPRHTTEEPGLMLLALALTSVGLLIAATVRFVRAARTTIHCRRLIEECGATMTVSGERVWIVQTDYPVAAVLGVLDTRLLLSRRILSECTTAEVASVLRHELAHIRRRDNLVQAAMRFLPDPFAHLPAGRTIQAAWAEAAEEAADDLAARDAGDRTDLASALVRVAGMAQGHPPRWMPALTFFERHTVESRVRRLLVAAPVSTGSLRWLPTGLLVAGVLVVGTEAFGLRLHALMELAVQVLP